jgi:hypothetical protein
LAFDLQNFIVGGNVINHERVDSRRKGGGDKKDFSTAILVRAWSFLNAVYLSLPSHYCVVSQVLVPVR